MVSPQVDGHRVVQRYHRTPKTDFTCKTVDFDTQRLLAGNFRKGWNIAEEKKVSWLHVIF